jgi:hypothetical protein
MMAYLGVAVLGVVVLGTAVLGVAVGILVLGVAVLGTTVLLTQNRSSNPPFGSASLSPKKRRIACRRKSTSCRAHDGPKRWLTLVWPCWAWSCLGPPYSALPCSGPALELEWAPEWARASGWTNTQQTHKNSRLLATWHRSIQVRACLCACACASGRRRVQHYVRFLNDACVVCVPVCNMWGGSVGIET